MLDVIQAQFQTKIRDGYDLIKDNNNNQFIKPFWQCITLNYKGGQEYAEHIITHGTEGKNN